MTKLVALAAACLIALTAGCGPGVFSAAPPPVELHVAAAANLASIFSSLASAELKSTGIHLVPSFGSTAQLAKQIEGGAPFDLFLAADTEHPVALAASALAGSVQAYARGRLVIWAPQHPGIHSLSDLTKAEVKVVAVAKPELAPYGHAAMESLDSLHLLTALKPKIVYGENISAVLSYADSGNADVALTAWSLVAAKAPGAPLVPESLHKPISQALCILSRTSQPAAAAKAVKFLLSPTAREIFEKSGYAVP